MTLLIISIILALLAIILPAILKNIFSESPRRATSRSSRGRRRASTFEDEFDEDHLLPEADSENPSGQPTSQDTPEPALSKVQQRIVTGVRVVLWGAALVTHSFVHAVIVPDGITMHKVGLVGSNLPEGRIIALNGEAGPQADILTPGLKFEFFLRVLNELVEEPVFEVPDNMCAILVARDGAQMSDDKAFADAFDPEVAEKMVGDAGYFLTNGGVRGPQTSVLRPGKYHFNHYLWGTPELVPATVVPEGHVGVVKSSVHSRVDLPNFSYPKPPANAPAIVREAQLPGEERSISAQVVQVGSIGLWQYALPNATYYLNPKALKVTMVPIRAKTWEYKGGYTRREIDLTVSEDGTIEQKEISEVIPVPKDAADGAVDLYLESWPIFQELRVVAQITAEDAPYVVAAIGEDLSAVEEIIMTPIIRDVVRDVLGGGRITVEEDGPNGDTITVTRRIKPLDLYENRTPITTVIEEDIRPEGRKAFTTIHDVRLSYSEIPPEVTLPGRMQQLSEQLVASYKQLTLAQEQRIEAEKQRALADKQADLQAAQIEVQRAELLKDARRAEGEGERLKLEEIAKGQKAQLDVLGERNVVDLRKYELMLDFYGENAGVLAAMIENAHRFVPQTNITLGGDGSATGLNGPAAIFGTMLSGITGSGFDTKEPKNDAPTTGK